MIEWATWWDLTLSAWRQEGLDPSLDGTGIKQHFGLDIDLQFWTHSFKTDVELPIYDSADYDAIRPSLYPDPPYIDVEAWKAAVQKQQQGMAITWLTTNGFFWWPRVLFGIENHFYAFYDHPQLMHRMIQDQAEFTLRFYEYCLKIGKPMFVTLAEDMSYNHGPMLSRELFQEFLAPAYCRISAFLRRHGIPLIVDTDGDATLMLPWLQEVGVDGVLPLERQAGVDINRLVRDFPDMVFIGGFDKMTMRQGESQMRSEFERILPAMKTGRFIPSVDHQTPPDVPLDRYRNYIELLREFCTRAVMD